MTIVEIRNSAVISLKYQSPKAALWTTPSTAPITGKPAAHSNISAKNVIFQLPHGIKERIISTNVIANTDITTFRGPVNFGTFVVSRAAVAGL